MEELAPTETLPPFPETEIIPDPLPPPGRLGGAGVEAQDGVEGGLGGLGMVGGAGIVGALPHTVIPLEELALTEALPPFPDTEIIPDPDPPPGRLGGAGVEAQDGMAGGLGGLGMVGGAGIVGALPHTAIPLEELALTEALPPFPDTEIIPDPDPPPGRLGGAGVEAQDGKLCGLGDFATGICEGRVGELKAVSIAFCGVFPEPDVSANERIAIIPNAVITAFSINGLMLLYIFPPIYRLPTRVGRVSTYIWER